VEGPIQAAIDSAPAYALGIMPGYPKALCDLAGFGERVVNRSDRFDGARLLAERLATAPVHSRLSAADSGSLARWVSAGSTI